MQIKGASRCEQQITCIKCTKKATNMKIVIFMLLLVLASFAYAESNEQTSLTEWTSLGLTKENKLFFKIN